MGTAVSPIVFFFGAWLELTKRWQLKLRLEGYPNAALCRKIPWRLVVSSAQETWDPTPVKFESRRSRIPSVERFVRGLRGVGRPGHATKHV